MRSFERRKYTVEKEESGHRKGGEDAPLEAARLPEHGSVAEGAKPEQIDPVGERCAAAEDDDGDDGQNEEKSATARAGWLGWYGPINGFGQFSSPLYLLLYW